MSRNFDDAIQKCIDECLNCHKICLETVSYCLDNYEDNHIKQLLYCAELSNSCASSILLKADNVEEICQLCEYICNISAKEYSNSDDYQIKKCADACKTCADACARVNMEMKC